MAGYLLDTNHLGLAATPGSTVWQRLDQARRVGNRFGTCVPVLCELEVGILQVHDPAKYRRNLARLLREVRVWPIDLQTVRHYGEVYHELRRKGRVLSTVDMMVAALARQMSLTVLSTDRDFEALPDIDLENWSTAST